MLRHTSSGTSYIFNKVANKAHSIVILSMVTCRCRTKEHTELLHTALVCRWSKRKTQQVHHGAAWTTGQGNSQRGCHCSLAGCRKLPEAHQRPATERGWGGSPCYLPSTSSKYLQIVIALRSIHTDWSCWQSVSDDMETKSPTRCLKCCPKILHFFHLFLCILVHAISKPLLWMLIDPLLQK